MCQHWITLFWPKVTTHIWPHSICIWCFVDHRYSDWLVQEKHNSIANALELRLSCINPSISKICNNVRYFVHTKLKLYILTFLSWCLFHCNGMAANDLISAETESVWFERLLSAGLLKLCYDTSITQETQICPLCSCFTKYNGNLLMLQ